MYIGRRHDFTDAFAYENVTVSNSAKKLTASTYNPGTNAETSSSNNQPAQAAYITVETDQIRFTIDGTTPDSSHGHLVNAGDTITLAGINDIANFQGLRVTTDATLRVTYFR